MKIQSQFFLVTTILIFVAADLTSSADELRFFVGTYTGGDSKGIYSATLNTETGKVSSPKLVAETKNPSFLAVHPSNRFLYAVGEISEFPGAKSGAVAAFAVDPHSGQLKLLNKQVSKGGKPCHLVVDQKGKFVLFANYGGGNVGAISILNDGKLGLATGFAQHQGSSVTDRQKGPHAHSINLDSNNQFAVAADLGLDKLISYRLTKSGELKPAAEHRETAGSGPRHFTFHPNGQFGYLLNELNATVSALKYDAKSGKFNSLQTLSTLPGDFSGRRSCAEVRIHSSGKFLYCSNRGHDSIATYQIDENGKLTLLEIVKTGGKEPRNFNIDPTGKYLLAENQKSDTLVVFEIDQATGRLNPTGQVIQVPAPVCIRFLN
ncbi:MAG: lactonase family protein [Pirellulaceae bacterium]|nr:lactonase family protein [Pirellulaceae bacterium]